MNTNLPTGAKAFNVVRADMNTVYLNTLPSATEDNIHAISNILLDDAYQPMLNEFITTLINRIGLTIIRNKSFSNPLALFKKGSVPLGTDIQEIYSNPATANKYEFTNTQMARVLTITDPDTHVAYYRRNRKDYYQKTITREELQGAFNSWSDFSEFISSITTSMYSGNYIDEFDYTKALIDGAYDNNKAIIEVVDNPVDETTSNAFLKKVRALYTKMTVPSTKYNSFSKYTTTGKTVKTWTDASRIVLIMTADAMANIDVDSLARAFNIDKANFIGRVITVDSFENENIIGVMCDEAWLQIYDNIFRFDEQYIASAMAWNLFLHAWNTYALSPFANAVILATSEPNPATGISIGSDEITLDLSSTPAYETLTITLVPTDATSEVNYTSSNDAVFTVTKVSETEVTLTPVAVGSATLTATTDNGLSASATVTVTQS